MNRVAAIACALALFASSAPAAAEIDVPWVGPTYVAPLPKIPAPAPQPVERLEMRSYQPYSGLQYGFRPEPPAVRGVKKRPGVIIPTPVAPLIGYGRPTPYTAQWYAYCAERFRSFEPETGLYTAYSGVKRTCR